MEPKYKVGDEVWIVHGNKIELLEVLAVVSLPEQNLYGLCETGLKAKDVNCWGFKRLFQKCRMLSNNHGPMSRHREEIHLFAESKLFSFKEALIQSLL